MGMDLGPGFDVRAKGSSGYAEMLDEPSGRWGALRKSYPYFEGTASMPLALWSQAALALPDWLEVLYLQWVCRSCQCLRFG
jgi:hypothetical protein